MADSLQWLVDDGGKPIFDFADALMVCAIPAATLQNWTHRKLFEPSVSSPGSGRRRKYTAHDLVVLTIAHRLLAIDVSTADALSMALDIWILILRRVLKTKSISGLRTAVGFVKGSKGKKRTVALIEDGNPFQQLADGYPGIIFAVGPVIEFAASRAMDVAGIEETAGGYAAPRIGNAK